MASPDPVQRAALYVGDLHADTTESDLQEAFQTMGPVTSVYLCRCAVTGKSLRYAYVNFHNHSDASKAMACLNCSDLKGIPMRIMWYQRDPSVRKCGTGNLFIKNLDPSVKGTCLLGLFCQFGTVLSCKVAEENGKSKGFGFVQFDSEESAAAARTALHDTVFRGKKLYVSKFVKKIDRIATGENLKFTNLYVKNLAEDMTEDALHEMFSKFGKVCNVVIMKDGKGNSRGFGFVNFESAEEARKAVDVLNGALMGSKILFVGRAQKKAERAERLKRELEDTYNSKIQKLKASNLYVKNLNASVDDKKLQEFFGRFGYIISSRVMRHNDGTSKRFGFVCFSTPEEAKNALDTLNGANFEGRTLYVAIAQSKRDRCKELHKIYAQVPVLPAYPPNCGVSPQYSSFYCSYDPCSSPFSLLHQPVLCQPYSTKHYQQNNSYYVSILLNSSCNWALMATILSDSVLKLIFKSRIPMVQIHLGSTGDARNWFCQDPPDCMTQITGLQMGVNNSEVTKPQNSPNSSNGATSGSHAVVRSSLSSKNRAGNVIYRLVDKLQPECITKITGLRLDVNNSETMNLQNTPNSLAKQANNKNLPNTFAKQANNMVQVLKEANARTSADGGVALQKSVTCLSY
ncbi:polyadenylate-binding protein 6-like [Pistacia vera]|uniref:polyadenylate-binding protein 6-like n=1 Tax=Pistacia vera TaxID=55513 RepID=UPI001263B805|nr:polyadenylate-binding protein 6-like [Pistacia vera]